MGRPGGVHKGTGRRFEGGNRTPVFIIYYRHMFGAYSASLELISGMSNPKGVKQYKSKASVDKRKQNKPTEIKPRLRTATSQSISSSVN